MLLNSVWQLAEYFFGRLLKAFLVGSFRVCEPNYQNSLRIRTCTSRFLEPSLLAPAAAPNSHSPRNIQLPRRKGTFRMRMKMCGTCGELSCFGLFVPTGSSFCSGANNSFGPFDRCISRLPVQNVLFSGK